MRTKRRQPEPPPPEDRLDAEEVDARRARAAERDRARSAPRVTIAAPAPVAPAVHLARDLFIGLTSVGILMLFVLHPDVPLKVMKAAGTTFKATLGLANRTATV